MKLNQILVGRVALGLLLISTAPACDVLTQDVPTALTPDDTFSSATRIDKAALGMYDALQNPEFYGGRVLIYGDFRSDDVDPPTTFFGNIVTFNATADNAIAANAWTGGYRTIYAANYFMQNLAKHPGVATAANEARYIGEAKFIRALAMFQLVNLYAQPYKFTADASHLGIPIQLVAPDAALAFDASQKLPRSTVRDVYTQVESDLLDAILKLPETGATSFDQVSRATKDAARGLLSRVYLYKGDYTKAAQQAGDVVTGNRHSLNADPATPFRLATYETSESIFSVAATTSDNANTNNALGQHYGQPPRRADITIDPYVNIPTSLFPANDKRRTNLTVRNANGKYYTTKYANSSADYIPVIRYPEILLTRAEALVRANNAVTQAAVDALNLVRDRSKGATTPSYTLANFATPQSFVDAALLERRLELAFEGQRLYDLLRNGMGVPARGPAAAQAYGSNFLVFPIPLIDIQQNTNLKQNDGY